MGRTSGRSFSLGWVLVSYFMLAGAMLLVSMAMGLLHLEGAWTGYAAFGGGALVGGFFAGRASPHYSAAESGLAGLLLVGSVVLFVLATPLGRLLGMVGESEGALQ